MEELPQKGGGNQDWQPVLSPRRTAAVFASMLLVLFFAALDQTIVSTALPKITADMHGLNHFSWVATAYMLTSTVTVPIYGKISDLFGRKNVLLFGIAVFLLGSLCCAQATSMATLIAARALQGLGAGALIPVAFAAMGNLYSPREIGKYQAFIAVAFVLASIVGPPVGGWFADSFGWRWAFYVNLPVGAVAAFLLLWLMPAFKANSSRKIDYLGAVLLVTALSLVLIAVDRSDLVAGIDKSWIVAAAATAAITFVAWEFRAKEPILNPRLFGNSIVAVSALMSAFTGATMLSTTFYLPAFLQVVMGHSAAGSGYLTMPFSLAIGIAATVSGYHASHTGKYRMNAIVGAALMSCGLALILWFVDPHATTLQMVIATSVLGLGLGVCVSLYGTIVRNAVSTATMGEAMAGLTLCRQLGATTGMAASSAIIGAQLTWMSLPALGAGAAVHADPAMQAAMSLGLHQAYAALLVVSVVALLMLIFALREIPLRETKNDPEH